MTDKIGTEIALGLTFMGIALAIGLANFGEDEVTIRIEHVMVSPDIKESMSNIEKSTHDTSITLEKIRSRL